MAKRKSTRSGKRRTRHLQHFPQVKGKVVERVELDVSPEYFLVDIRFQDKTSLSFDMEPCVSRFP